MRAESEPTAFLWLQLLDDGCLAGVGLAFGRARFPKSWGALGIRSASGGWWALGVLGGLGAALAAGVVTLGLERVGWPAPAHPVDTLLDHAAGLGDLVVVFVAVTGPVAVGEEVFFRGFAYRLLRARFGVVPALGLTAAGFALAHGLAASAWLPVLPVGVVLGLLAEKSGSLGPPVVGHAVVNAVAVLTG